MMQSLDLTPLKKALDSLMFAIERTEREAFDEMLRDSVIQRLLAVLVHRNDDAIK